MALIGQRVARSALLWAVALAALLRAAAANETLENLSGHRQICDGVYSADDIAGPHEPHVTVSFAGKANSGSVAVLVYPYDNINYLGFPARIENYREVTQYMCTESAANSGFCSPDDVGKFAVDPHAPDPILNAQVKLGDGETPAPLQYKVGRTGYYCVASQPSPGSEDMEYTISVSFQNPYGYLPGSDYPLILFHFVLCLVYVLLMVVWTVPLVVYRHNVLKVQKYITALGFLMILEQFFVSLYYFVTNKQGHSAGSNALLGIVAFWSSARLAYTFFLLLIVGHGYSVVHPSLGPRMKWCRMLGLALFITAFVFSGLDYYESNADASRGASLQFFSSIAFFPLVLALAANYFLTLQSLTETLAYLRSRKQTAKVDMYRRLSWILIGSGIAVMLLLAIQIIQMMTTTFQQFVNGYWRHKWLLSDGWPNIVYCVAFTLVMFLWRPNSDNKRYAMSTQLAQSENDAEEFEIGSLNGSDDEEANVGFDQPPASPPLRSASPELGVGAQRETVFDADRNHELSDLEGGEEFEVDERDRRGPDAEDDEDPLVAAPSGRLGPKSRRNKRR